MRTTAPAVRLIVLALLALAGCAGTPSKTPAPATPATAARAARGSPYPAATEDVSKRGEYTAGGLYAPGVADSAPADTPDVERIPEPVPDDEPRSRYGNRDYSVQGKRYHVLDSARGYRETGLASYYGSKFHRRRTSSMEVYDMYAFSAAHRTLPLPSFVRVTNLANGKSVVVRVNDRGPFHSKRIIDLSYAAAVKLDMVHHGTSRVEVVALSAADADDRGPAAVTDIATNPANTAAATTPAVTSADTGSALDRWVQTRPAVAAPVSQAVADTAAPIALAGTAVAMASTPVLPMPARARMPDGTGLPASVSVGSSPTATATGASVLSSVQSELPANPAADPPVDPPAAVVGGETWQLASYRERAIADHALQRLQSAGVGSARLQAATAADGSPRWRLRIGPLPARNADELRQRAELRVQLAGLGFTPVLVADHD